MSNEIKTNIPEDAVDTAVTETAAPAVATTPHDAVTTMLVEYGLSTAEAGLLKTSLGIDTIDELALMKENDLVNGGMKLAKARKMLAALTSTSTNANDATAINGQFQKLLPTVPKEDSWLTALKASGVLKVDESTVIAAIRAAIADQVGLFDIPDKLVRAMEDYTDKTEEQVDATVYYSLRKAITKRSYGDLFAAIDGCDGSYVTEKRRKDFLKRIRENLMPAIGDSFFSLNAWYENWSSSMSSPSVLLMAFNRFNGANNIPTVAPPDIAPLRAAGEMLNDSINSVFKGTGVQIAAALGYDANEICKTLKDNRLPALTGFASYELMLKSLNIGVSSSYIYQEENLIQYVLGFIKQNNVTADEAQNYFIALWQLGSQIKWETFGIKGIGKANTGHTSITGNPIL